MKMPGGRNTQTRLSATNKVNEYNLSESDKRALQGADLKYVLVMEIGWMYILLVNDHINPKMEN